MYKIFKQLKAIIDTESQRAACMMFFLLLGSALVELVGVASIFPFLSVLMDPEAIYKNQYLASFYVLSGAGSDRDFLAILGLCTFLVFSFSLVVKSLAAYWEIKFPLIQEFKLARRFARSYFDQDYAWFLNHHSSDVGKMILSEISQVTEGALNLFILLVSNVLVAVLIALFVTWVNPSIAASFGLIFGAAYFAIFNTLKSRLETLGEMRVAANNRRFRVLTEAFGGIKSVKVASLEETYLRQFEEPALTYAKTQALRRIISQLPRYALEGLVFGGMILVLIYLINYTDNDLTSVIPLVALFAFAGYRLMPSLQQIYGSISGLKFAGAALDQLHSAAVELGVSADAKTVGSAPEPIQGGSFHESMELVNVSFKYNGAPSVAIDGISLSIKSGMRVGIVGSTGSGKSTLMDLMLGLLTPTSGEILIDGTQMTISRSRPAIGSVGYVPQEIFLADQSIGENIAFGEPKEKIDTGRMKEAAKVAQLHDFIVEELPGGYDTKVGERGVRLSGGQRQRIGIARALYWRPRLLFLDEATSSLDDKTERLCMEAVESLSPKTTIVMIAHRVSTLRNCDTIYRLEGGKLLGESDFERLQDLLKPHQYGQKTE